MGATEQQAQNNIHSVNELITGIFNITPRDYQEQILLNLQLKMLDKLIPDKDPNSIEEIEYEGELVNKRQLQLAFMAQLSHWVDDLFDENHIDLEKFENYCSLNSGFKIATLKSYILIADISDFYMSKNSICDYLDEIERIFTSQQVTKIEDSLKDIVNASKYREHYDLTNEDVPQMLSASSSLSMFFIVRGDLEASFIMQVDKFLAPAIFLLNVKDWEIKLIDAHSDLLLKQIKDNNPVKYEDGDIRVKETVNEIVRIFISLKQGEVAGIHSSVIQAYSEMISSK